MKPNRILFLASTALVSALTFSGCGGQRLTSASEVGTAQGFVLPGPDNFPSPSNSGSSSNGAATTPTAGTSTTGVPPLSFHVAAIGYTSYSLTVRVNKVLKVQFTPGVQDSNVAGSGFAPLYSQLGVYIGVGSSKQPTPLLHNGMGGAPQESSSVMDYSTAFTSSCAGVATCRQTVTITVSQPNNDYYCLNFGAYCPYTHVPDTYPWNGTLRVQTDDTDSL